MAAGRGGLLAGGRLPWLLAVAAGLATAAWVVPVVLTRSHGFDVSDEGSYVLAYRWWDTDTRNFTGAQYLYGPVFEAVGHSVGRLRLFRLASVLVAHAVFGWAFMSWVGTRFPSAVPSRAWAVAGSLVLVAVGGVTYGWLPLSPGYNDVVALGCLVVMAVFLRSWRAVLRTCRLPVGPALALPIPVLAMVMAKWSSAVVALAFLGLVFAVVAAALRPAGWVRFIGAGVVGTVALVLAFDLLVAPLDTVVPPLIEVNRLAAGSSHTAGALVDLYVSSTREIMGRTTALLLILAAPVLVAAVTSRTRMRPAAPWIAAAGPVMVLGAVSAAGPSLWPEGGGPGLADYSAAIVALVITTTVVLATTSVLRRRRAGREPTRQRDRRDRDRRSEVPAVLAMMLLLPVVQAVGSGNSLSSLAVNVAASWMALIIVGVVLTPAATWERSLAVASGVALLVLCVSVGADGVVVHPYRATAFASSDHVLGGTGTLAELAMSPTDVGELEAVRRAMAPTPPGRRPVLALDEIAGLALLTEGRPLGEPWTSALAPERLAAGIRAACDKDTWTGIADPIVLAWRPVSSIVTDALAACGVRLDGQTYREESLPVGGRTIKVFTPRG